MRPFRLLTLAAFAAATVPRLAHRGMFVDGVTYASIARNLAEGRGTFWAPSYTATIYPQFYDHPPLGFWLQSLWFRVLGDHLFVERVYVLAAGLATALGMIAIWRVLNKGSRSRDCEWLAIAFWIAVPVVSWSIAGNVLEVTVSVFTTVSVAAILLAELSDGSAATIGWGALSGLCIVLAFLTKGPVGLFPLAAPVLSYPLISSKRHAAMALAAQWSTVLVCGVALMNVGAARASLAQYVDQQVFAALGGRREVSTSSFTILRELVQGVALPIGIAGALIIAAARRFVAPSPQQRAQAWWLLLMGLAGTLPILASAKQAGHYLVPAVPFYGLAAASVAAPTVNLIVERVAVWGRRGIVTVLTAVLMLGTAAAAFWPGSSRDRQRLADLDHMDATIPRGETIGICPESNGDWGLHAWFERRFEVSLDATDAHRGWFLKDSARSGQTCPPSRCAPATDPARQLVLMKCSPS